MKNGYGIALAIMLVASNAFAQGTDGFYKLGPDSLEQDGVPRGKIVGPLTVQGKRSVER